MLNCQQIGELLSGLLDRELTPRDRQRVEIHLETCPSCQRSYEELAALRQSVGRLSYGELTSEERNKIMSDMTTRTTRGVGWFLFVLGFLGLMGYAGYELWTDDTGPALIKILVASLLLGLVSLFVSVLWERLRTLKTDKYKDVEI